ncbi:Uncharacterised protein [Burkholderia oklahomensis]|nr:hypothetical protein BG90_2223 [Burkholderia oklahomensis C6786]SUW57658.1 Uncharacterised protein [Burkholderia oklahomensis]
MWREAGRSGERGGPWVAGRARPANEARATHETHETHETHGARIEPRRVARPARDQFPLPRATRRAFTDSARPSSTFTLSSQLMHASVMLWP